MPIPITETTTGQGVYGANTRPTWGGFNYVKAHWLLTRGLLTSGLTNSSPRNDSSPPIYKKTPKAPDVHGNPANQRAFYCENAQ